MGLGGFIIEPEACLVSTPYSNIIFPQGKGLKRKVVFLTKHLMVIFYKEVLKG